MISYIMVSYNTLELTKNSIHSIFANCSDCEVVLVDNGSTDGTVPELSKIFRDFIAQKRLIVLDTKVNNGFSKGNNIGAFSSRGDYLVFINPDTIVSSDIGAELAGILEEKYRKFDVIISPKILNPDKSPQHCLNVFPILKPSLLAKHLSKKILTNNSTVSVDWITGVCFCMKKETFYKYEGWNERFDLYSEDLDFCYRVKRHGGKVVLYNDDSIIHFGNQSGKQVYSTPYSSFKKKTDSLRKFYQIYFNDKKFLRWLKFLRLFTKNKYIKQYIKETFEQ